MTYRELYEKTFWDLQVGDITPEEFEERVKPLNQEPTSAIEELEKIISYTNNIAKNIIEQGVPDFNGFTNKDEALALYGFAYIKVIAEHRISELKGEAE